MEQTLKVYIYSEGDRPIFHQPEAIMEGIYASEGWFMKLMESNHRFLTKDPNIAHLFYLPFSTRILQQKLYVHDSHSRRNLVKYLKNYLDLIASNYPFWNRTRGSDHFFTACHDWAPAETRGPYINCIRSLCNADVGVDFVVGKDVSLPETKISSSQNPNGNIGGNRPSKRTILAFFAGNLHGYVRPILLNQWSSRPEPDMKIFNRIDHKSYIRYMKRSRFCVCAKGYEVNSPRVVESVLYGCVPVIISDNFVPPFLEILNWESFAVFVPEKEIPNLRKILISIPVRRYVEMQKRVMKVQKHFMWHDGEPARPSSAKSEPRDGSSSLSSRVKIDPSIKDKKKIVTSNRPIMSDSKPRSSVSTVTAKSEAKPKVPVNLVKSTATTSAAASLAKGKAKTTPAAASLVKGKAKREKKVYSLPGQKFDPPEEREPLRIFYESLSKQIPGSEMAEFWLMEHGMLSPDKAKRAFEKKQRKMKQIRMGTPTKPAPTFTSKAESSQKTSAPKNNGLDARKKKKVVDDDDDDDDDFILSHKRRKV
ncbi:unnamed protein product [Arabidopsis lyrata]|nr:unnamed protein product [Arabidopsis lyrata]